MTRIRQQVLFAGLPGAMPAAHFATFRDARDAGWTALGHCGDCLTSKPGNVARFAAGWGGDQPISALVRRGAYLCSDCGESLVGVTLLEPVRPDGMRQVIDYGDCPPRDPREPHHRDPSITLSSRMP